jgi:hypothetical protein
LNATQRQVSHWAVDKSMEESYRLNSVMDIQAVNVILNSDVELHIMPISVSGKMTMDWKVNVARFKGNHDLLDFLLQRWYNHLDYNRVKRTERPVI